MTNSKLKIENSWYVLKSGRKEGPYSIEEIIKMINPSQLNQNSFLWKVGLTNWKAVKFFPELNFNSKTEIKNQSQVIDTNISAINQSEFLLKSDQTDSATINDVVDQTYKRAVQSSNRRSYISRHWRGELSLPICFWINGVLLNLILISIMKFIPWENILVNSPKLTSAILVFILLVSTPIPIWQLVGIWKSSSEYLIKGKPKLIANIVKYIVIINLINSISIFTETVIPQLITYSSIAIGNDPIGTYQIRVIRDATELEIFGPIIFGLTDEVQKTLDAHPTIKLIHLNSIGGRVSEARKLRDLIDSRNLTTYTSAGCSSACTLAFIAGHKRLIAKNASLGFHQYSFPGAQSSDFNEEYSKDQTDWIKRGISSSFIAKAFSTPNNQMWNPSKEELLKAGFITGFPDNNEVALSGIQLKDIKNIEASIVKIPMYSTIKKYEPKTYNQIILEFQLAFQKGNSQVELQQKIRPLIFSVLFKKLPFASNESLIEFLKITLEQMEILFKIDPNICFDYLFSNSRGDLNITEYFSNELVEKEISAISEVITSSAIQTNQSQSKEYLQALFTNLVDKLNERYGKDVQLLLNPELRNTNKEKTCIMTYIFYKEIIKLPINDTGDLLRYLFSLAE